MKIIKSNKTKNVILCKARSFKQILMKRTKFIDLKPLLHQTFMHHSMVVLRNKTDKHLLNIFDDI